MTFNERFRNFAEDLSPTTNDKERTGKIIDNILQELRFGLNEVSVHRITPSHRFPRKSDATKILNIDLYVYFDQNPPFTKQISHIDKIVASNFDQNRAVTKVGIFFKYEGVNFVLMAATNCLLPEFANADEDNNRVRKAQHSRALNRVTITDVDKSLFITSLSCLSVRFEETRNEFSHSLSRLAKVWFSHHRNADKVVDGYRIMEYLGDHAAGEERMSGDLVKAFSRFLTMMAAPECITVFWMENYDSSDIPNYIRYQRPLLLDPCNPYNNMFAYGDNINYICSMKGFAKSTLRRLNNSEITFKRSDRLGELSDIFQEESTTTCTFF